MPTDSTEPAPSGRLNNLLQYLAQDPTNLTLLSDAAATALAEHRPDITRDILGRYAAQTPLPDNLKNLAGLAALQLNDFAAASAVFDELLESDPDDPSLRFNLAWSRVAMKDFDGALEALDAHTIDTLPQAAMLHIQILHEHGELEEAMAAAKQHLARHPAYEGLLAAISVLAIDAEDTALAGDCAQRAGNHPDALTTLGTLSLGDGRYADAAALFERALEKRKGAPRAWIGKGLAELSVGAHAQAAQDIQHGAELFSKHIGSWIAAGWAHILSNDIAAGRACFETALAIDGNFSESHGSLAVMAILEGRINDARTQTQIALRLDRQSFSGALAQALILNSDGKPDLARKLIERALHTPVDSNGRTIAQVLVRQGLSG